MDIPKKCLAGCVVNPGADFKLIVEDVDVPEPGKLRPMHPNLQLTSEGDDELLLRLSVTGLCYSDIHYMLEDLPMIRMSDTGIRSAGHEGIGVVVKIGQNVKNWKVGDRAGVKPLWDVCHECELCFSGQETYCLNGIQTGLNKDGTYQSYITSPARYTTRIPDEVDDFTAAPLMCAGATILNSLRTASLQAGSWVVFIGAGGGVGHIGVQIARAMGMRVIGIDGGEEKRRLCTSIGCTAYIDFTQSVDVEAEVQVITKGKGAQGVFVVATSPSAYKMAPNLAGVGGRIMCVGLTPLGKATVGGDPAMFIGKNLHVIGTLVGSMRDAHEVLQLAAAGLVKPIYTVFEASRFPEAVQNLRDGKVVGRAIIKFDY
ncbi:GroES-like protein [Pyrenochaeta sp. DS3sAY3a]|nr:GroES-like protein [Pyrenochaeta sp. DS3sAY3a]